MPPCFMIHSYALHSSPPSQPLLPKPQEQSISICWDRTCREPVWKTRAKVWLHSPWSSAACAYSALIMNHTVIKCRHFNPLIHFIDVWLYETQTRQLNIYNRLSFLHHFYSSCNQQVSRQMLWDHEELNSKRAPHWVALFMNLPVGKGSLHRSGSKATCCSLTAVLPPSQNKLFLQLLQSN